MVGIASVLTFLYPTADPFFGYRVVRAPDGDHITVWDTAALGAQPDEASLATTQASGPYQTWLASDKKPNRTSLHNAITQFLSDADTYLALPSPNAAQTTQAVQRLVQAMKRVIVRLAEID